MKKLGILLISIVLISCQSEVKKEDLNKLNGYWEIKQVKLSDGENKDYKINETIDYFELRHPETSGQLDKSMQGFRQKVMPQFDGTYKTNGIKENIKIIEKEKIFFIEYKTSYGKWQEEILEIADSTLVLKNKANLEYTYKKYKPFSLK